MAYLSQSENKTVFGDNRETRGNSNSITSGLTTLVGDGDQRRGHRENDSLSGSRTRSSSRTTSGNPDSSRSRSLTPSFDQNRETVDSNRPNFRKRRFLQRWDDDLVNDTPEVNDTENKKEELPYVYQQPEFVRITQDIIRKCDAEDVLVGFFTKLDGGESFDISSIKDQQLKKKLRHLSKALYLERNESEFKKPPECKISLFEIYNELLPFIKTKINSQPAYQRKVKEREDEDEKQKLGDNIKRKLTKEEASELLSLREMHEQGFFVDYENIKNEFDKKQKTDELWGKTPEEQKRLLSSENEPEEQPWRVFDREKDFLGASKTSTKEYKNLLNSSTNFNESFKVVSKSSSFM